MKLTIASLLVGSAAAFAPTAPISGRNSALNMVAAGTATEGAKVRLDMEQQKDFTHDETIHIVLIAYIFYSFS